MSLNQKLTNLGVNAEIDALTALLNGGFVDIYDGTQPTTADTAITTQNRLASLAFGNPAFGAGVAGVATANAITSDADADATGVATWYRCWKSDHTTPVTDGSAGKNGYAADGVTPSPGAVYNYNMNSAVIQIHAQVSIDSFVLTASKT